MVHPLEILSMPSNSRPLAAALVFLLAAAVLAPVTDSTAQVPDKAGAGCINTLNKGAALLAKTHLGLVSACAKGAITGKVGDFESCVAADTRGKIVKGEALVGKFDAAKCLVEPPFGYATPEAIAAGAAFSTGALVKGLFGADAGAALLSGDKALGKCQSIVLKQAGASLAARLKEFAACKKAALKAEDLASAADLESACFGAILADEKRKIAGAASKLATLVDKKCSDVASAFPGVCAAAGDFAGCVDRRAACASCRLLNAADGLARDCDEFDDGVVNDSCSTCGNARVETGEDCDDGGASGCCSASCTATNEGSACDDGLFCTATDLCSEGVCVGAGDPCAAGGECASTCDENGETCNAPADTACASDDDVCTDDVCDGEGACVHPLNSAPCDDADPCTTLDTCVEGTCLGQVVPPSEVVMSDDFDDGALDAAWVESFTGVATGWSYVESGTEFTVSDIVNSTSNEWGYAALSRDFEATQDFRLSYDIGWDSEGSLVPIQDLRVMALDGAGNILVYAGYDDAWAAYSGTVYWAVPGCPSGCSGAESRGTRPLAGTASFVIERISNQISITEGATTLYNGEGGTAPIETIVVEFAHWRWSGAGGSPTFGEESIDFVTFEAVNAECSD